MYEPRLTFVFFHILVGLCLNILTSMKNRFYIIIVAVSSYVYFCQLIFSSLSYRRTLPNCFVFAVAGKVAFKTRWRQYQLLVRYLRLAIALGVKLLTSALLIFSILTAKYTNNTLLNLNFSFILNKHFKIE